MVLMNPGLDRSLQAVRADVALNAEQIHQDIRLAEQASILASHQFEDLFWWNWFGAYQIRQDSHDAGFSPTTFGDTSDDISQQLRQDNLYFELEIIPYQSRTFRQALSTAGGLDKLRSSQLSLSFLQTLMCDAERDDKKRLFITRGKDLREYLSHCSCFKHHLQRLDSDGLLYTFNSDRSRNLRASNLIRFDVKTGRKDNTETFNSQFANIEEDVRRSLLSPICTLGRR